MASALLMSTHIICFRAEIRKNISTFWMKTRLLWSNVIYFQGRDSEIEPVERETIGNISSFIAVPVAESTSNLPLHQTSPIQQIELNESTDIDVDQSIEDLVSQSISSSNETQTNIFFMKGDFWPSCIPLSVVRPCVNISIKTFLLLLAQLWKGNK